MLIARTRVPIEQIFLNYISSKIFNVNTKKGKPDWLTFFKTWFITMKTET